MRVEIYGDANRKTVSGPTVQFTADDAAPVTDLKAQITPSIAGYSAVTIAANGQNTNVSLTKSVYGGSADITTGVVTETHGGGAYNPTAVPSDLSSKIVSATTARSASGSVASFNCSLGEYPMSALTAAINPVQDLHGYDSPWPAGGGVNLYNANALRSFSNNGITATVSNGTITLNGTATANAFFSVLVPGLPSGNYVFTFNNPVASSGVHVSFKNSEGKYFSDTRANAVNKSVAFTGEPNDIVLYVASGATVTDFVVKPQLETGSTPTAWTPYSNICPITGWTGCEVDVTGGNLIKVSAESYDNSQACTSSVTNSGVTITATGNYARRMDAFSVKEGQAYTVSFKGKSTGNNNNVYFCKSAGGWNDRYGLQTLTATETEYTYTFTATTSVFAIGFYVTSNSSSGEMTITDLQLERGSTATDYVPYNPNSTTYPVSWQDEAGTVYGGTLDVTTGKLTVDRAAGVFDGSENITWHITADGSTRQSVYCNAHDKYRDIITTGGLTRFEINIFKAITNLADRVQYTAYLDNGYLNMQFPSGMFSSVAELKSWLSANNVQFTYPFATPVTYTLTPQQIATLTGQNNVWSDTGDVTVSYRDGLLSNVSGIMTNSTALTTGENITYTLSQERTFQIPGTVIRTVVGNNVMSASTGNISVTWSFHWFDITPWIAYQGLTFSRNDVDAPDAGRDMSGYMHRGRVGVKEKMNVTTVQLTRAQSSTLQTLLYPETIQVRVTPYPRTNTSHTMSMYTNNVKTTYVIHRKNGEDLQSLTFPLIEN